MTDAPAYFLPLGDGRYRPTDATTSPWDAAAQHGGPPTALLATAMDEALAAPGMRLARITVEFLGPIPRRDLSVETRVLRPGKRIMLSEASMTVDGRPVAIARAWHIATGAAPPADTRRPTNDVPPLPAEQEQIFFPGLTDWGYGESIEWRFVHGGLDQPGPGAVWTRLRIPLIDGQPRTGLQHMLVVADAANGISIELPIASWLSIPTGITATLLRHTAAEWVYLAAESDVGSDGIGITLGQLADSAGSLGQVSQPLLVAGR